MEGSRDSERHRGDESTAGSFNVWDSGEGT